MPYIIKILKNLKNIGSDYLIKNKEVIKKINQIKLNGDISDRDRTKHYLYIYKNH